jgi:hypothetical protein
MVLPIPMAMLMPMMAFVLLSERHPLLAKKQSFSSFTIQITPEEKKIEEN